MDIILGALRETFTINILSIAFIGTTLGIIWGAMPGVTSTMAVALLVGATAKMSIYPTIMWMISVFVGSVYGGSITAVLINIPGKPTAIPTAIEGYPLMKRGEGGLALGMTIICSFIGNWIGIVAIIIFIPAIMAIALKFGSWEIFLLAFWGIAICGTLTGKEKPVKGWISGWIGLLLATVGIDPIHAVYRFTFGLTSLADGVGEIPVLVGLFGLAEVIRALSTERMELEAIKPVGRIIPSLSMLRKHIGTIFRSGLIGLLIGALPAAGPNIASFLSYVVARQTAKGEERKQFGKGSYRGLIAAEVADNACIGGDLLPTMTLGIPGSAAAAVFLGALNLHAIRVGPALEIEHPGLLYFLYISLIVTNLLMYGIALLIIKPGVKLFTMRKEILMPLIVPLCAIGAYGTSQSPFEMYVMLAAGISGYLLQRMNFPLSPMILGLILGPMADENLRKAIMIFQGQGASILDILSRPVGTIMLIVVALTFYKGIAYKK
jgi:putative tricarboxylic transport membrane protein